MSINVLKCQKKIKKCLKMSKMSKNVHVLEFFRHSLKFYEIFVDILDNLRKNHNSVTRSRLKICFRTKNTSISKNGKAKLTLSFLLTVKTALD